MPGRLSTKTARPLSIHADTLQEADREQAVSKLGRPENAQAHRHCEIMQSGRFLPRAPNFGLNCLCAAFHAAFCPAGKCCHSPQARSAGPVGIRSACTPARVLRLAPPWACALLTRRGSRMGVQALWHALREEGLLVVVRGSDGEAGPHSVAAQVCSHNLFRSGRACQ